MAPDTSKTATPETDPAKSRQAGFSSYGELSVEPANPPNGRLVEQTLGTPAEGPAPLFGKK